MSSADGNRIGIGRLGQAIAYSNGPSTVTKLLLDWSETRTPTPIAAA